MESCRDYLRHNGATALAVSIGDVDSMVRILNACHIL